MTDLEIIKDRAVKLYQIDYYDYKCVMFGPFFCSKGVKKESEGKNGQM